MTYLTEKQLNIIRGKAMVGQASSKEVMSVFDHLDQLELWLNETDYNDFFGTEGWRHAAGLPDAD
jgi:hypothetical protein